MKIWLQLQEMAKLAFLCNVVVDEDKKTVAAFAGNSRQLTEKVLISCPATVQLSLLRLISLLQQMAVILWIRTLISVQRA